MRAFAHRGSLLWHVSACLALTALACGSNSNEASSGGEGGHLGAAASGTGGRVSPGQGGRNDGGTTAGGGTTGVAGSGSGGLAAFPSGGSGQAGTSMAAGGHAESTAGHGGQTAGNGQGGAVT